MSKNHPHDNIYSILGKLDALKPTPEETRFALVKEIRESVEAQGSILTGVDAVQDKLQKQFAESQVTEKAVSQAQQKFMGMVHAAQKGAKPASPEVAKVAKSMGKKDAKDFASTKHKGLPQHVAEEYNAADYIKELAQEVMQQNGYHLATDLEPEDIEYIGGEAQVGYADVCKILGCPLPKSLGPVKSYDKHGDFEEGAQLCPECGMTECSCPHTNEGEITRKQGVTRHTKTDYPGYPSDDLEQDDDRTGPKSIGGRGRPRKAQTKNPRPIAGAEKKGRGRPASVKSGPVSMPADPFGRVTGIAPKGKRGTVHSMAEAMDLLGQQLGQLNEGRYLEDSNGETLNHILNRFKHDVKRFEAGEDIYGSDLYHALFDYYSENGEMPYGTQKARDGDPANWIHDRLDLILGDRAYGKDPANAEGYGIENEAGIPGNLPPEQVPGKEDLLKGKGRSYYEEEVTMEDELNELARLAGIHAEGNAFTGKLKNTANGDKFELDGKTFTDTSTLDEEPEMEEGNEFSGELSKARAEHKDSFEVDGKEYPVKESFEQPGQPEFSLNTSIDSDGRKTVSVNAEGEQAEALLQMLKMAGLGSSDKAQELEQEPVSVEVIDNDEGCEVDEADAPVDQPSTKPVNGPEPEYKTMRASTMGPGEGDAGEKTMNPDRPTFKNGDNALSNPPARGKEVLKAVAALESKLAAEYESIKKVSK
jgi:Protein of unknwon function (DUF3008)